jgi:nitroreductase
MLYPILQRRSIRKYTNQNVSDEDIKDLLHAGMAAPSAGNQRPWHFIVVRNRETLEQLAGVSPYAGCVKEAPVAIVVCGDLHLEVHKGFWVQDCAAAVENILICIEERGLGSVWIGLYPLQDRMIRVRQILDVPEAIHPFAILPLGHPGEKREPKNRFDPARIHIERW